MSGVVRGGNGQYGVDPWRQMWAPTLTSHDPNPPLTLETASGGAGDHTLTATGFANAQAFGAAAVNGTLAAAGFANSNQFGQPVLRSELTAAGLANAPVFGTAQLRAELDAVGVAGAQGFGTAALQAELDTAGLANVSAFGMAGISHVLEAAGFAGTNAFGSGEVQATLSAAGIASASAVGSPSLSGALVATGVPSAATVGTAELQAVLAAGGIQNSAAAGTADVWAQLDATGLASTTVFGQASIPVGSLIASGIPSSSAVGTPELWAALEAGGLASINHFGRAQIGQPEQQPSGGFWHPVHRPLVLAADHPLEATGIPSTSRVGRQEIRPIPLHPLAATSVVGVPAFGAGTISRRRTFGRIVHTPVEVLPAAQLRAPRRTTIGERREHPLRSLGVASASIVGRAILQGAPARAPRRIERRLYASSIARGSWQRDQFGTAAVCASTAKS